MDAYNTLDELWVHMTNKVLDEGQFIGSRDGACHELIGQSMVLLDPTANIAARRKISLAYAAAECLWYLSGTTDIALIKAYAPQYERFSDDGVTANGAYGGRLYGSVMRQNGKHAYLSRLAQLEAVIQILQDKPDSRQAVLSLWQQFDLHRAAYDPSKDLPCTLSVQFILRQNTLNAIMTMRSNDLWLGLPYDVFCFTTIQRLVADQIGAELGWFKLDVGSLHIYQRNVDKVKERLKDVFPPVKHQEVPGLHGYNFFPQLEKALEAEYMFRSGNVLGFSRFFQENPPSTFTRLLAMIATKLPEVQNRIPKEWQCS